MTEQSYPAFPLASRRMTDQEIRLELKIIESRLTRLRERDQNSPTHSWKVEHEVRSLMIHRTRLRNHLRESA